VERVEVTIFVDTHIVVWLVKGEPEHLSSRACQALENDDVLISPAVMLELGLLHEIGRLRVTAEKTLAIMESEIGLRVCSLPFHEVATHALKEKWTRDPFDRLIVANAKAAGAPLITKDELIRKHYRRAIW
jgi:PIN domain nuclease of toxin-antitoxin system